MNSATPLVARFPAPAAAARPGDLLHPPGGLLIWLVVFVELLTFGLALAVFVSLRAQEPELFRAGQAGLHLSAALANTLLLLTGGWWMANATARLRQGDLNATRRYLFAAATCGLGFLVVKGSEYAAKIHLGLDLSHDTFHTLYWLITGFHYLHVFAALLLLLVMARGLRLHGAEGEWVEHVESSAIFWHFCDLVWLLLLPVVYLLH